MRYCCPNCGNIDRSQWMQNRWRTNVYFILEEYEEDIPPNVLVAYNSARTYSQDKDYAYRLCKRQGIIERILIEEAEAFGFKSAFMQPREPVDHSILGYIPKLAEFFGFARVKTSIKDTEQ